MPDTLREPTILMLVNGERQSAAAERARRFAAAGPTHFEIAYRTGGRSRSLPSMARMIAKLRPDLIYCMDLAAVPLLASLTRGSRCRLIVDTGDYPSAFLRHIGARPLKVAAALAMEEYVYRSADAVVVRSHHHGAVMRGHGAKRVAVIPDGVDLQFVQPSNEQHLRSRLRLTGKLTVGIAGHFTWYECLGGGLGWELVHALALLPDLDLHGVLLGEGPGLDKLRVLARELGVADRLHILGKVPYSSYGRYLGLMDVCLLTQTNDPASWVRTTGKLPGYMAAGKFILASSVGTAEALLPSTMLIDYDGRWDSGYPAKLADRIRNIAAHPEVLEEAKDLPALAEPFAYSEIAAQGADLISSVLSVR